LRFRSMIELPNCPSNLFDSTVKFSTGACIEDLRMSL
jgi:hypothetical protein